MQIVGWVMLGLFSLFMIGASALPKFLGMEAAKAPMQVLGWPPEYLLMIGVMEVAFTLLVLWPRTSLLGGILMMALLGGAIAANLRVGNPLYSHTLFGVYLGVFMWLGICLRDPRIVDALLSRGP